jgi:hypothetical protein
MGAFTSPARKIAAICFLRIKIKPDACNSDSTRRYTAKTGDGLGGDGASISMSLPAFPRPAFVLGAVLALLAAPAHAQLRVANWNVTNYSAGRVAEFQTAIYAEFEGRSMSPDVLITQEILSATGAANFLNILNTAPGSPGDWALVPFIDGPDTDNACFYRTSKLTFLQQTVVATGGGAPNHPRNINRYDFRLVGYEADSTVIALYSTHMKSGSGSQDLARRLLEAERIRADARSLNPAWNFILGGDFNIPNSNQAAYQELVGVAGNPAGRFFDPISTPGSWQNNAAFRFLHTQDPVGAGGMDDRFDILLLSDSLIDGDGLDYIGNPSIPYSTTTWDDPNHSYRCWGNDGTSFDGQLTVEGNTMVGPAIATALRNSASNGGHLPVFLDLRVPAKIDADEVIDFGIVPVDAVVTMPLVVTNVADVALWTEAGIGDLRYSMVATDPVFNVPAGMFFEPPTPGGNQHDISLDTSAEGEFEATLVITSNDPDQPVRLVSLFATVGSAILAGDLNCDGVVSVTDIGPFVLALTAPEAYDAQFPDCDALAGDTNNDGILSVTDIGGFVALLTGGL